MDWKKLATFGISGILVLHCIIFISLLLFFNREDLGLKPKLFQYYYSYTLIGPFFPSKNVIVANQFFINHSCDSVDRWIDTEGENFLSYHKGWGNFSLLKRSRFEKKLARKIFQESAQYTVFDSTMSTEIQQIQDYFRHRYQINCSQERSQDLGIIYLRCLLTSQYIKDQPDTIYYKK